MSNTATWLICNTLAIILIIEREKEGNHVGNNDVSLKKALWKRKPRNCLKSFFYVSMLGHKKGK